MNNGCKFCRPDGNCFLTKSECQVVKKDVPSCKYVLRQAPLDKEKYLEKFEKTLNKVLKKRNIFNEQIEINFKDLVDFNKSVFENVKIISDSLPKFSFTIQEKREVMPSHIMSGRSVLESVTQNLWREVTLTISEKNEETNELVVFKGVGKYLVKVKKPVGEFLGELREKRKPEKFYLSNVVSERLI